MKAFHIIIIMLLLLLIIINIYYSIYVKRQYLENFEDTDDIKILSSVNYTDEPIQDMYFPSCTSDSCGTTVKKLETKDKTFLDYHSEYHKNYSYNNIVNKSKGYGNYSDIMARAPLFAYRCLNKSPKELSNLLKKESIPFAHIYKKLYIYNESMLVDFIQRQINAVLNTSCYIYNDSYENANDERKYCDAQMKLLRYGNRTDKVQGPIYVIVSQSPYLRINEENKARFEIVKNQLPYFVEERINGNKISKKMTGDGSSDFSSLYAEVLIVFPLYTLANIDDKDKPYENLQFMQLDVANDRTNTLNNERFVSFMRFIKRYIVHDELCLLKCNKGELKCGCLNAKEGDMDFSDSIPVQNRPYIQSSLAKTSIKKYNSVCLAPDDTPTNRSVMYYVNPYSGAFIGSINNPLR